MNDDPVTADSCAALTALQTDVEAFMAHLLAAAIAVKREQGMTDNAEAFDYTVSFLSGMCRALALTARDATIEGME
ncbi:MAG: hypothetical protein GYA63_05360 [Armatimonadetes bacterium]|jgi:hypothetical protein|nr:hypothetical protein [Armatimonadota bacterium]HOC31658.1 hypothetical protein [Armatimonadota bacterium]